MNENKNEKSNKKIVKITIISIVTVLLITILSCLIWYFSSTSAVNKNNSNVIEINIPEGSYATQVADILIENKLIKNKTAFKIYIKLNNSTDLKAGTYYLKQNMSLNEIINIIKSGNTSQKSITYIEGKNIRWLAKEISKETNNTEEDVFNLLKNGEYIDSLIEKYWFLTDEIKDENIYYPLEGYLFPDTYSIKSKDVKVEEIFEKMLDEMENNLNDYKEIIESNGYDVNRILTVASIIEMESMTEEGRKDVSSVIHNRLNQGMPIQSDVTTYYAFKVDIGERDLYQEEINRYNPYNTRGPNMEGKLPVGPISSVSKSSIDAALNPNATEYIFFVADKNGKLYFSKTNEEHNQIINDLQEQGLWYEY